MTALCLCLCISNANAAGPAPSGLRLVRTQHYEIHTDLDPAFVTDLASRMDVMYDEYCRRLSQFSPPKNAPPLAVYLFTRQRDYMALTQYKAPNTGGIFWMGQTTFLASFLEDQGRDSVRRTLQHEAFHQFAYFAIAKDIPIWLNEGLAQLFEEGIWTGKEFLLGQVPPRRVRQLQEDMKSAKLIDFKTFLAITPEQWSDTITASAETGATYYNQAWAMVHFLTESGNADYRNRMLKYLELLHRGEEQDSAWRIAFPGSTVAFQNAFVAWARTQLKPTNEAMLIERQDTLGDFLVALAQQHQTFTEMTQFRAAVTGNNYRLQYVRGHITWTTSDSPQIYFSNIAGQLFSPQELFFQRSQGAPLMDIVCHASQQVELRTHFYMGTKKVEHEVLVEQMRR